MAMLVGRTTEAFGRLDVLVNNVGRAGGGGLLEATDDDWRSAFDDTLYPAIPGLAAGGAAHAAEWRWRNHHDCIDMGPRVGAAG